MYQKKLAYFFLLFSFLALLYLAHNLYSSYMFKNSELPLDMQNTLHNKEQEILINMQRNFGFVKEFPLVVSDKIPSKLYGVTTMDQSGKIVIYLNKKVMQESFSYIVESVVAHEYAHALIFHLGLYDPRGDGHSKEWQEVCQKLGARDCRRYVDSERVILGKLPF